MKLRQVEYCHDCNKHVTFEFEDVVGRQILICPSCGHEHYREIDEETIAKVRTSIRVRPGMREVMIMDEMELSPIMMSDGGDLSNVSDVVTATRHEIIGTDENGCALIKGEGEGTPEFKVMDRRWGQDPSQRGF